MSPATPETLVIVNPTSAGGRTLQHWPGSAELLRGLGVAFEVHFTTAPGDATEQVRMALRAGVKRIVSVGGDGTLNEVVNGFFDVSGTALGGEACLGIVPSGTGGDFRRTAHIPLKPVESIRLLAATTPRRVDVGRIDYADGTRRHFINIADCGIGGEVVARVNRSTRKSGGVRGSAVFLWQSLAALLSYHDLPARITIDGKSIDRNVHLVAAANGQYFGGGMRIAPHAELDDGMFDVIVVDGMSRMRGLISTPSLYRGAHVRMHGVTVIRGREVRVEHVDRPLLFDVDGEQVGGTPATLTCLPAALALCAAPNTRHP